MRPNTRYSSGGEVLLDADGEAVMMGWERPLMRRSVAALGVGLGARVLNVGFGLGILDRAAQLAIGGGVI